MDKISYYNSDSYSVDDDSEESMESIRSPSPEPLHHIVQKVAQQA